MTMHLNGGDAPHARVPLPASTGSAVSHWDPVPAGPGQPAGGGSISLARLLRLLRQRWRLVLSTFLIITGGVALGVSFQEPVYRATAAIEIRKQAAEVVPTEALFQYERISDQYLQTEYATLRGRALVQRTLSDPELAQRFGVGDSGVAWQRTVERVQRALIVDPVTGSRVVRIGFDSPDPQLSADFVNIFVEQYAVVHQEAAAVALVRLGEQADSIRTQLVAAERELNRYVKDSGLAPLLGGGTGETIVQERLRRLQQELTDVEAEGYRAAALSASASANASAALESDLLRSLRSRIAELHGEYARLRPTFTDSFPRMRQLRSELAQLDNMLASEQKRVSAGLASQHNATLRRRQLLQRAVDEQQRLMENFSVKFAEYERRRRDVDAQTQLLTALQQKRKEASLSAGLSSMDVAVLEPALPSLAPVRPRPARDIPLAALTGLLLGLGLAFLRDYADGSLRTPEDVDHFGSVPLLAMIPAVRLPRSGELTLTRRGWHRIDERSSYNPELAEAFHGLRTSVLFDAGGALPRTLLVTSSVPGEGKTTVSTNLAISMAALGRRVLLIDADLRRPSIHRLYGLPRGPGLSEHLAGVRNWRDALCHGVSPNLDLLTAGGDLGNPSDLLSDAAMHALLAEAGGAYEFVVLDAPALFINVPDARILAHAAAGVLLVVRSGSASREVVARLVVQTPNLVGIVLNQLNSRLLPSYYSQYGEPPNSGGGARDAGPRPHQRTEPGWNASQVQHEAPRVEAARAYSLWPASPRNGPGDGPGESVDFPSRGRL